MATKKERRIILKSVRQEGFAYGVDSLTLETNEGAIMARYHETEKIGAAVLWVGGAGGGLDGPAGGLYPRLAGELTGQSVASLRLHYRFPNDLENCVIDTLLGVHYLRHEQGH